ncbi:MAG: hypothetical protein ACR2PI_18250 [Hyphomicrobiaceae bacterium]
MKDTHRLYDDEILRQTMTALDHLRLALDRAVAENNTNAVEELLISIKVVATAAEDISTDAALEHAACGPTPVVPA